jgi:hypothetical protein
MAAFGGELFTREQMQGWLNHNLEHQAHYGYGLFSVIRKSDGLLITVLSSFDRGHDSRLRPKISPSMWMYRKLFARDANRTGR